MIVNCTHSKNICHITVLCVPVTTLYTRNKPFSLDQHTPTHTSRCTGCHHPNNPALGCTYSIVLRPPHTPTPTHTPPILIDLVVSSMTVMILLIINKNKTKTFLLLSLLLYCFSNYGRQSQQPVSVTTTRSQ